MSLEACKFSAWKVGSKMSLEACKTASGRTAKRPGWGRASENMPSPGKTTEVAQPRAHSSRE